MLWLAVIPLFLALLLGVAWLARAFPKLDAELLCWQWGNRQWRAEMRQRCGEE